MTIVHSRAQSLLVAGAFYFLLTLNFAEAARGLRKDDEHDRRLQWSHSGSHSGSHSSSSDWKLTWSGSHSSSSKGGSKGKGKGGKGKGGSKNSKGSSSSDDGKEITIKAYASGAQEFPENTSTMKAMIEIKFAKDLSYFDYQILVQNGYLITEAYLKCNEAGKNGLDIVKLFGGPITSAGSEVTLLAKGTVTASNIISTLACTFLGDPASVELGSVAGILEAINRGIVYLNVYTEAYPYDTGEVRAQLFLLEQFS